MTASIIDFLIPQNPHWFEKPIDGGISRPQYLDKIIRYHATGEVVILNGVRRAGKTTLLRQTINKLIEDGADAKSILFVNCDEPGLEKDADIFDSILETYRRDVFSGDEITIILDEIQTIPGWERWIKAWYDRKTFRLIISGSSSHLLDLGVSSKISGRYLKVPVYPLSFAEYLSFLNFEIPSTVLELRNNRYTLQSHLRDYLRYGGFPAVVKNPDNEIKEDQLQNYFDSILYRDIQELHNVRNAGSLRKILTYMTTNISAPFSYRKLSVLFDVDVRVISDYLNFAEESNLLFELRNFSYSLKSQNSGSKKIYCVDNGLRNAVSFRFSDDAGKLAENTVFIHLRRLGDEVYFWNGKNEVDFVVKHKDYSLSAVNVCYTDEIPMRETAGLLEFAKLHEEKTVKLVLITRDVDKEEDGILYVPLWKWLLEF